MNFQPSEHSYGVVVRRNASRWSNVSLKSSSVVLTDAMKTFLDELDKRLPFKVVVTSGLRTAAAQAQAMWTKISAGESMYALYAQDDLVKEIMDAGKSPTAVAAVLTKQMARGRYLSDHMRGDALDFRSWNLSSSQQSQLMSLARSLGAKVVDERTSVSPHIHVEDVGGLSITEQLRYKPVQSMALMWGAMILSGGVAMLGLAIVYKAKKKRKARRRG